MNNTAPQWLTRTRAQLCEDFTDLDQQYTALFKGCSRDQTLWRPANGSWAVAECIEHVARGISQYLAPIRQAIAKGGPESPADGYLFVPGGWFSASFVKRIGPQVTMKFKAPGKIQPISVDPEVAFDDLRRGHAETLQLLHETAHLNLNRIRFKNPFIPLLRFTVATGFLILAAHGRRHLLQAQRVVQSDRIREKGISSRSSVPADARLGSNFRL